MKYCIKVISKDPKNGKYVSKKGSTTNKIENILVVESFCVLYAACEYWNTCFPLYNERYVVEEFVYEKIRDEIKDLPDVD